MADATCSLDDFELAEAARAYGIPIEILRRFATDYLVLDQGQLPPDPDEPLGMSEGTLAVRSGLPLAAVKLLQKCGALNDPLTCEDLSIVLAIKKFWGRRQLVELQITRWATEERAALARPRREYSPLDRWIYAQYADTDGGGAKRYIDDVVAMAERAFGAVDSDDLRCRIRQLRKAVRNDRQEARRSGKTMEEIKNNRFGGKKNH